MITKRQAVWNKSKGKCWYCGTDLPEKGWHADHYYPIVRNLVENRDRDGRLLGLKTGNDCQYPELDTIDNLVPSCAPCNNFKSSASPEGYRFLVAEQFKNTLKNSTGLRQLNRMGLVDITAKPVDFWFEKQGLSMPSEFEIIGISEGAMNLEWKVGNSEPDYFYVELELFICSLRRIGNIWLAIAIGDKWHEFGRKAFPNGRNAKYQAAEWAIRLNDKGSDRHV